MNFKKLQVVCFISLFLFASNSVFGVEEYVSNAYKEIDQTFIDKSEDLLNDVLQKYQDDKNYYLIENYAQKKIRRLIMNDEYNFAMSAIIVVIENNLDNEDALEMYSAISDAFNEQKRQLEAKEELKHQEELRVETEKEKKRGAVEKEYVAAKTASGSQVYITGTETKSSNNAWKFDFGMLNFANIIDTAYEPADETKPENLTGINYGISLDFTYEYLGQNKILGVDTSANMNFLAFGDSASEIPILVGAKLIPKIAFPSFSKNLFIRAGFEAFMTGKNRLAEVTDTSTITNFYSPLVGISFERLSFASANLTVDLDYLPGHLFYDDVQFAAGGKVLLELPFAETEKFDMTLNLGVKENLFVKTGGIENRASVILAIGAKNGSK